jgi:hypothetical protein
MAGWKPIQRKYATLTAKDLKKCRIDSKTDESADDGGNM